MKKLLSLFVIFCFGLPVLAITEVKNILVQKNEVLLSSRLKKYYTGYEYVIKNTGNTPLKILSAEIENGNNGSLAYINTINQEPSAMATTWIVAGPLGLCTLGVGWVVGIIATPIVSAVSKNNQKRTRIESTEYNNDVELETIQSDEKIVLKTLVPLGCQTELRLEVQNLQTKEKIVVIK